MKLAAIYNVWDGEELLRGSIDCIKAHVDVIIIMYQDVSNFGESHDPLSTLGRYFSLSNEKIKLIKFRPTVDRKGFKNEIAKRNEGIEAARYLDCTHFLHIDCDEYYKDFAQAKEEFLLSDADGSVCRMFTYFKNPTLRFAHEDNYYVPFIHQLKPNTNSGCDHYQYYVDPTRRVNCDRVMLIKSERMHHFSYVRKNIERKINNSSARANILKSKLLEDYNNPEVGPGFYVQDFKQRLIEVPNYFNINI
jgi:hypothetical protein